MFLKPEFTKEIKRLEAVKRLAALARVVAATPVDTGAAKKSWKIRDNAVVSDSKYMDDLNRGSSAQAPMYFIESSVLADPDLRANGTIVLPQ